MTEKTKFISIKVKLLGIILPVIIIIMTVLTGLFYYVSKNVIQSNAHDLLQTSVESQASEMEAWLERNLVSVSVAKQAVEEMGFDDAQLQDFLDSYYNYDNNYSEGFYIIVDILSLFLLLLPFVPLQILLSISIQKP